MLALFRSKYAVPYFVLATIALYAINMFGPASKTASAILGFALIFLAPGYSWVISMNYTDKLEEFVVGVALSISLVIISLITMNLALGITITQASVFLDVALLSLAGLAYWQNKVTINAVLPKELKALIS